MAKNVKIEKICQLTEYIDIALSDLVFNFICIIIVSTFSSMNVPLNHMHVLPSTPCVRVDQKDHTAREQQRDALDLLYASDTQ